MAGKSKAQKIRSCSSNCTGCWARTTSMSGRKPVSKSCKISRGTQELERPDRPAKSDTTDNSWGDADDDPDAAPTDAPTGNALDLTCKVLLDYVKMELHEIVASSLWIAYTHVSRHFMHAPRWWLHSPVRGCGKTTALAIAERLVPRGRREGSITPASIYRLIDQDHCTLLLDEGDNLGLCKIETFALCSTRATSAAARLPAPIRIGLGAIRSSARWQSPQSARCR